MTTTICPTHAWCIRDHGDGDNSPGDHEGAVHSVKADNGPTLHTMICNLDDGPARVFLNVYEAEMGAEKLDELIDLLTRLRSDMQDRALAGTR